MNATAVTPQGRQNRLVPMLLIMIGTVLFGANVGLISGDAPHGLLHLWPALLVVIAPDLLIPAAPSVHQHLLR